MLIFVSHEFDWLLNIACLFVHNVIGLWSCAWIILMALIDFLLHVCLFWIVIIILCIFVLPIFGE